MNVLDDIVEQFEADWQSATPPDLLQFVAHHSSGSGADSVAVLHELVMVDLWHRWRMPDSSLPGLLPARPVLSDYCRVIPQLGSVELLPAEIIREEFRVRMLAGQNPQPADYQRAFPGDPRLQGMLEAVLNEMNVRDTSNRDCEAIYCPHCREPLSIDDHSRLDEIHCIACGSTFGVARDALETKRDLSKQRLGRFELLNKLGEGSFGTVWKSRDTQLGRTVAVKVPRNSLPSAQEKELFLREARAASHLHHPNIVAIYDVVTEGDRALIVSEWIPGVPLSEYIEHRSLSARAAAELCAKVALGLHYAHEQGVVHRDLKPANIMIDDGEEPHILDFGLARRNVGQETLTLAGDLLGTPAYMSPELARGEARLATPASDIYSLGVILFQLLTGELPFRGNANMMMMQIIHDEPPSPRKLVGNVSRDLETICLKCLQKEPSKRFATAEELAQDLRRCIQGLPIKARPIGPAEKLWKLCRAHPRAAATVVLICGLLSTLVVVLTAWSVNSATLLAQVRNREAMAVEQHELAINALSESTYDVQSVLEHVPEARQFRQQALDRASMRVQRLVEQFPANIGDTAEPQRLMLTTYAQTGTTLLRLGKHEQARPLILTAHRLASRFEHPPSEARKEIESLGTVQGAMGELYESEGEIGQAQTYYQHAVDTLRSLAPAGMTPPYQMAFYLKRLGRLQLKTGQGAVAIDSLRLAHDYLQRLIDPEDVEHPIARPGTSAAQIEANLKVDLLDVKLFLGQTLMASRPDEALQILQSGIQLADSLQNNGWLGNLSRKHLSTSYRFLGALHLQRAEIEPALRRLNQALSIDLQIVANDPQDIEWQRALASVHDLLGSVKLNIWDPAGALEHYREGWLVRQQISEGAPASSVISTELAWSYYYLGNAQLALHDHVAASDWFRRGLEICEPLRQGSPQDQLVANQFLPQFADGLRNCQLATDAENDFEHYLSRNPNDSALLLAAHIHSLANKGDLKGAEDSADRLAKIDTPTTSPWEAIAAYCRVASLASVADESTTTEAAALHRTALIKKALQLLQQRVESRAISTPLDIAILERSPDLAIVRDSPEFAAQRDLLRQHLQVTAP